MWDRCADIVHALVDRRGLFKTCIVGGCPVVIRSTWCRHGSFSGWDRVRVSSIHLYI